MRRRGRAMIRSRWAIWLAACALSACATRAVRKVAPPDGTSLLDRGAPYLKAHRRDGHVYVLSQWNVEAEARVISGVGRELDVQRQLVRGGPFRIGLDEVVLLETNVLKRSPATDAITVVSGVSVAVTVACAVNPKACFGSCPTFYVDDGERPLLQAEGFSASVAPSLEARDVDALYRARPAGTDLHVRMTNEALETHVVRYVHVLAAPRPAGGRVFADAAGAFWQAPAIHPPASCRAPEGDCQASLSDFDGSERWSRAGETDLGRREELELEFAAPPSGRLGLVVAARQTLVSTYLFYQGLAYMGRTAGDWLARLERGDARARQGSRRLSEAVGGIEVSVRDGRGRWKKAGELYETGPLATDVKVVPLPEAAGRPARVRLGLAQGHWRLDWVGLAALGDRVDPLRLPPTRVEAHPATVVANPEAGHPGATLTTLPGDAYDFRYRLPAEADRYELFLETRGYYLEWMREEWMREEDPARLARLFRDPRRALRELAPAFKRQEAEMERLFWGSRYAR